VGQRAAKRKRYVSRGRDGFLYLKAGEYEVYRTVSRRRSGGVVLGTVRVLPGRASVFRVEIPPGALAIRVELPQERARKTSRVLVSLGSVGGYGFRYVDQIPGVRKTVDERHVYDAHIDGLYPGKYRVVCGTASEIVEVGAETVAVVLLPPR
jgi:hypothetical protein